MLKFAYLVAALFGWGLQASAATELLAVVKSCDVRNRRAHLLIEVQRVDGALQGFRPGMQFFVDGGPRCVRSGSVVGVRPAKKTLSIHDKLEAAEIAVRSKVRAPAFPKLGPNEVIGVVMFCEEGKEHLEVVQAWDTTRVRLGEELVVNSKRCNDEESYVHAKLRKAARWEVDSAVLLDAPEPKLCNGIADCRARATAAFEATVASIEASGESYLLKVMLTKGIRGAWEPTSRVQTDQLVWQSDRFLTLAAPFAYTFFVEKSGDRWIVLDVGAAPFVDTVPSPGSVRTRGVFPVPGVSAADVSHKPKCKFPDLRLATHAQATAASDVVFWGEIVRSESVSQVADGIPVTQHTMHVLKHFKGARDEEIAIRTESPVFERNGKYKPCGMSSMCFEAEPEFKQWRECGGLNLTAGRKYLVYAKHRADPNGVRRLYTGTWTRTRVFPFEPFGAYLDQWPEPPRR